MGIVTETAPDVLIPGVNKKPQKVVASRVKEPSSLSMGTADILKMLSRASPATAGVSMRSLQDVERRGQMADSGLEPLRRRAEAEADAEKQQAKRRGPPTILTKRDWVRSQPHFAHLKDPKKKRLTKRERDSADTGYVAYLARVAAQARLDLSYSKDFQQAQTTMADIALKRAQTESAERANRPQSIGALGAQQMLQTGQMQPRTARRWEQQFSKEPGIEAQDQRAAHALAQKREQYGADLKYKQGVDTVNRKALLQKEGLDRQSREGIERRKLEQKNQEKIVELMGTMEDVIPYGTPEKLVTREVLDTALRELEGILARLRGYGMSEGVLDRLRWQYKRKILEAAPSPLREQVEFSGYNR